MKRCLLVAALATTALSACGGDDGVSPDQLKQALVAQGIEESYADCIVTDLEANLSEDDFNTVALAPEDLDGLSPDLEATLTDTVNRCVAETSD